MGLIGSIKRTDVIDAKALSMPAPQAAGALRRKPVTERGAAR